MPGIAFLPKELKGSFLVAALCGGATALTMLVSIFYGYLFGQVLSYELENALTFLCGFFVCAFLFAVCRYIMKRREYLRADMQARIERVQYFT